MSLVSLGRKMGILSFFPVPTTTIPVRGPFVWRSIETWRYQVLDPPSDLWCIGGGLEVPFFGIEKARGGERNHLKTCFRLPFRRPTDERVTSPAVGGRRHVRLLCGAVFREASLPRQSHDSCVNGPRRLPPSASFFSALSTSRFSCPKNPVEAAFVRASVRMIMFTARDVSQNAQKPYSNLAAVSWQPTAPSVTTWKVSGNVSCCWYIGVCNEVRTPSSTTAWIYA